MKSRILVLAFGAALTIPTVIATSTLAVAQDYRDMSCEDLWYERNAIYAENGYCFKTQRARGVFGRGCFPPYGKLSSGEAREVARIEQWEMRKGCR